MMRRPPKSTRTDPRFPDATLFRSVDDADQENEEDEAVQPDVGEEGVLQPGRDKGGGDRHQHQKHRHAEEVGLQKGHAGGLTLGSSGAGGDDHKANSPLPRSARPRLRLRSEEHTSELQSLMSISYAVFCLKTQT